MYEYKKIVWFYSCRGLITLGIIGVVAAITIPTLMSRYRDKQTVARLTETYSILLQAIRSVQEDEGTPDEWNLSGHYYQKMILR